ncbi:probable ribonuclease ZC3H12D isoform X1 [Diachasmimorpha longicaudata]|uniref:probable ribonuclease ZC3H12D isoform X1 n=1 Tax=Diachasmimorpha longicaudata TaxID=58733 RepID=UPI0030B8F723
MGEVPRIRIDRRCLKQLKDQASTIERLFGVRLSLSCDNDNDIILRDNEPPDNDSATWNENQVLVPLELSTTLSGYFIGADVGGDSGGDKEHNTSLPDEARYNVPSLSPDVVARVQRYVDCTVLGRGSAGTGTEAEDSSYDSDYEAEDSIGSTVVHSQLESQVSSSTHSDVSRTTSDTLAAEFAEYVTVRGVSPTQTPGYTARVEFALKLGYTERLVQVALHKLGPDPGQNELLAELIRLGASSARFTDSPEDPDYLTEVEAPPEEARRPSESPGGLRPVVIDGSNVAMSHGNKEIFSCRGIQICVDWFRSRGHKEITVFVPKWRKEASRPDNPIADQEILGELERDRLLVFTPSRLVGGKRMVCYDDRYILRLAAELDGIVVSNDNYRDLAQESPEFRKVVEERILMYSFVNDRFMPPDDPLGRSGPTLDNFLRTGVRKNDPAPPCPYAKKCTYGNKCKFRHPERGPHPQKSVTERLVEHAQRHLQARGPSLSLPLSSSSSNVHTGHQPLCRARSAVPPSIKSSTSVPKSRSVENVTDSVAASVYVQQLPVTSVQGYSGAVGLPAPRVNNPEPEPANMHRKLQRQLTLNPACDPRLYQLRRYHQQPQHPGIPAGRNMQHRPLVRHASNESYGLSMNWDPSDHHNHQHVMRIASAPDSSRGWPPRGAGLALPPRSQRLGTSEPQLNLVPSPSLPSLHPPWTASQTQDARRRLHYHLANIFPEEQVQTAMSLHPHETDPQKICAAILAMFPKP